MRGINTPQNCITTLQNCLVKGPEDSCLFRHARALLLAAQGKTFYQRAMG
jgi:hypothetical protein